MKLLSIIVSFVVWAFAYFQTLCASGQLSTEAVPQTPSKNATDECSIFGVAHANDLAWSSGDFLVRQKTTFDTSRFEKGQISGVLQEQETLTRVIFDYPNRRFAYFRLTVKSNQDFSGDKEEPVLSVESSDLQAWVCEGPDGQVAKFNRGGKPTRWNRTQFKEDDHGLLRKIRFPDYRGFWIFKSPIEHNQLELSGELDNFKSGMFFHKRVGLGQSSELWFNSPVQTTDPSMSVFLIYEFDNRTLLPIGSRRILTTGRGQTVQGGVGKMKWEAINDIFVVKSVRQRNYQKSLTSQRYGPKHEDFDFHWFSMNEPIDPSLFRADRLTEASKVLELVDPKQAGADSLVDEELSAPGRK